MSPGWGRDDLSIWIDTFAHIELEPFHLRIWQQSIDALYVKLRASQSNGSMCSWNFCMSGMFRVDVTKSGIPKCISTQESTLKEHY